jgi:putative nucleotidyltransferase-like protein
MRREEQLLLRCATTHLCEERTDEICRILSKDLNWDRIMENEAFPSIAPMLFHNLQKIANEDSVPQPVMDRLKRFHHSIGLRNMQIYSELRNVTKSLKDRGIQVIFLKGAALAETVYPDMSLRPMSDIDLLVKKADLHDVAEILSESGYVPSSKHSVEFYEGHHHLMPYLRQDKFIMIEVHHNIAPAPFMSRLNTDSLWESAQVANIAGVAASVLSPEDLVLHLCLHMADDFFVDRMKVLVDISEAIRYYGRELDWRSIIRKSNECQAGSFVHYSLYLAKEMMDALIPTYVLRDLDRKPELKLFEATLLAAMLRKNILRRRNSFLPSWFITSLCREFFHTPAACKRLKNILKLILRSAVSKLGS